MNRFMINKRYSMWSPCQQSCTWEYEVERKTRTSIWLRQTDVDRKTTIRRKLYQDDRGEYTYPLGRYSMCPLLRA